MSDVAVIIPWRSKCPHRMAALEWVKRRYAKSHPTWRICIGELQEADVWVKARAVQQGLDQDDSRIVVIADADVWSEGLAEAVHLVRSGHQWAVPHTMVHRLDHAATAEVLAGGPLEGKLDEGPYRGHIGGGLLVLRRELYDECPLDPRFAGWGGEDDAWGHALSVLAGRPARLPHILWHLWHPPQERPSRTRGSAESVRLMKRYRVTRNPVRIRALIAEHREVASV